MERSDKNEEKHYAYKYYFIKFYNYRLFTLSK